MRFNSKRAMLVLITCVGVLNACGKKSGSKSGGTRKTSGQQVTSEGTFENGRAIFKFTLPKGSAEKFTCRLAVEDQEQQTPFTACPADMKYDVAPGTFGEGNKNLTLTIKDEQGLEVSKAVVPYGPTTEVPPVPTEPQVLGYDGSDVKLDSVITVNGARALENGFQLNVSVQTPRNANRLVVQSFPVVFTQKLKDLVGLDQLSTLAQKYAQDQAVSLDEVLAAEGFNPQTRTKSNLTGRSARFVRLDSTSGQAVSILAFNVSSMDGNVQRVESLFSQICNRSGNIQEDRGQLTETVFQRSESKLRSLNQISQPNLQGCVNDGLIVSKLTFRTSQGFVNIDFVNEFAAGENFERPRDRIEADSINSGVRNELINSGASLVDLVNQLLSK